MQLQGRKAILLQLRAGPNSQAPWPACLAEVGPWGGRVSCFSVFRGGACISRARPRPQPALLRAPSRVPPRRQRVCLPHSLTGTLRITPGPPGRLGVISPSPERLQLVTSAESPLPPRWHARGFWGKKTDTSLGRGHFSITLPSEAPLSCFIWPCQVHTCGHFIYKGHPNGLLSPCFFTC